jgi:hypothetical protein
LYIGGNSTIFMQTNELTMIVNSNININSFSTITLNAPEVNRTLNASFVRQPVIQWGVATTTGSNAGYGNHTVYLNTAYGDTDYSISITERRNSQTTYIWSADADTEGYFTAHWSNAPFGTSVHEPTFYWNTMGLYSTGGGSGSGSGSGPPIFYP